MRWSSMMAAVAPHVTHSLLALPSRPQPCTVGGTRVLDRMLTYLGAGEAVRFTLYGAIVSVLALLYSRITRDA